MPSPLPHARLSSLVCGVIRVEKRGEYESGNLVSNGFRVSDLRKVACTIRRALFPFKCGFSPFSPHQFMVRHRPSSLMLREYRLTHRGILVP
jgi:hypothetical protein